MKVMVVNKMLDYIKEVLENMPTSWLGLTTHRLDIYNEKLAKVQFLEHFEILANENTSNYSALNELPTAFDYIRLGHPLSCVLEWLIAKMNNLSAEGVISFSSKTMPVLAILRKNLLENKKTQINYTGKLPNYFDIEILRSIYGYKFELNQVDNASEISEFNGSNIFISQQDLFSIDLNANIDFFINIHANYGSIVLVNGEKNKNYISEIQHVRRRETIAMTPKNCFEVLNILLNQSSFKTIKADAAANKIAVLDSIKEVCNTTTTPLVASSGLSIQYAILMGLVDYAKEYHKGKSIKIIVPPNCYGGTNDQVRRAAACIETIEIMDLLVDGDHDMVQSLDFILNKIAAEDAVPYVIAEIPTNPRVEVPDLVKLRNVLSSRRKTESGELAIAPVFLLDQTFCPNLHFLGEADILSTVKTISFASGSKFPSGGLCTAGYCIANKKGEILIDKIDLHLKLCDNEATDFQMELLAKQLPSMKKRIHDAYLNTRDFVNFIKDNLPEAKINFVSEELAKAGFTPSVFSLDLPTKGNTEEEKEAYKRNLNLKLINMMINEIPNESKNCVSYGQLKGSYWTIPATSTQGTTKEDHKDYIARVSLSPQMDIELHKKVFLKFIETL